MQQVMDFKQQKVTCYFQQPSISQPSISQPSQVKSTFCTEEKILYYGLKQVTLEQRVTSKG